MYVSITTLTSHLRSSSTYDRHCSLFLCVSKIVFVFIFDSIANTKFVCFFFFFFLSLALCYILIENDFNSVSHKIHSMVFIVMHIRFFFSCIVLYCMKWLEECVNFRIYVNSVWPIRYKEKMKPSEDILIYLFFSVPFIHEIHMLCFFSTLFSGKHPFHARNTKFKSISSWIYFSCIMYSLNTSCVCVVFAIVIWSQILFTLKIVNGRRRSQRNGKKKKTRR